MFSDYFQKIEKKIIKKAKPAKKIGAKDDKSAKDSKSAKQGPSGADSELKDCLNNIVPSDLKVDDVKIIDPSGYSPEGIDLVAYKEKFRDIGNIMGGSIPCDLVFGTYHLANVLNKDSLNDSLTRVLQAKKINQYTESDSEMTLIPAFIIGYDSEFKLPDLKNLIIDHYMAKSIDHMYEVDIIAILGKGIIVKDWREKRSYIAIETGKDTLMWCFILMNEYLDIERGVNFDLRFYVKHAEKYNEY